MHTPTPWTFETVKTSIGHCHKIMPMGACLYVDHRDPREVLDPKTATARANAAFIVRACNAHDDLVASASDYARLIQVENFDRNDIAVHAAYERLRAALAKATQP